MTEPERWCIVDISEKGVQDVLEHIEGFGDVWVTGWCSEGRCIFSKDKVVATKILLLTRGRGFSRSDTLKV
jgi:hypothetical protein